MSKPFLLLPAVALLGVAPFAAPGAPPQASSTEATVPVKVTPESQAKAKKIFAMDCAVCHGTTGDGKTDLAKDMDLTLVDWSDPKALADHPNQELFSIIRSGKGKMPAEDAGRANDAEVWNLIVYIRGLAKQAPAPAPVAAGGSATQNQ